MYATWIELNRLRAQQIQKMNLYRETVQGYNVKRIGRLTMSLSVRVKQFSVGEGDICTQHRPEAIAPCLDLRQVVFFTFHYFHK